ncbi:iron-sulfur cluster assembly protein [Actinoplanes sp. NBC_00393]|uniref:iron-sulfur cluster assembly protein n=1 Tax=Actinoplanes sp. NBC_00393 TaxID=2975953 RepID=UPI002E1B62BB
MSPAAAAAWAALGRVRDPELDQPITDLGFVASLRVEPGRIRAELQLPTYFCAPNFAWLMVADAHDELASLGGGRVEVVLLDHFAAEEINAAVTGFDRTGFETDGADPALDDLRATFDRKAHTAAQERLARTLAPLVGERLPEVTLEEAARLAPDATAAVVRRRARLGLSSDSALCDERGARIPADRLPGWLRFARTVRVSVDGNATLCRGLLETRYGLARDGTTPAGTTPSGPARPVTGSAVEPPGAGRLYGLSR